MNGVNDEDRIWLKQFGDRLKRLIHIEGMTQAELAKKIGIDPSRLSKYVTGTHAPDAYMLHRIANALDCDVKTLFDETF